MDNSYSIFIADDNEINRLLLQSQLENLCSDITLAANGKIALNYLQNNKYDLILLDIQMPYYSGLDLIKIIKKNNAINQNTPAIAITAQAQNHQRQALVDAKFDECLIKPILLEQIEELVNLWRPSPLLESNINSKSNDDYASQLLQKTSGNIVLANTIFNKLFIELPSQLFLIEQALKTNNLRLAFEVIHKLHGSVSFCGFTDIQILASKLEQSIVEKDVDQMFSQFDPLKKSIEEFLLQKDKIVRTLQLK